MKKKPDKPVVLAVDDTPENLDVVKGILVPEYTVKVAPNGKVALKIAQSQAPDLILLDIMMPEMDGYEVCRRLKSNSTTADIPVIFLTAKDQTADEAEGFDLGAADYILKPVNPQILHARVATHVALKQRTDALQEATRALERANARMEQELNAGKDIQNSMLPGSLPETDEITLFAQMNAAREVGGDFFDYFFISEDELYFCLGDVAGKGVASGLFMAMTKTLLKSRAADDCQPASIMTRVNNELSADNPSCMFITVFLGILNTRSGELVYTNAGHNPPLVIRNGGAVEKVGDVHGPIVGVIQEFAYKHSTLHLQQSDVLLVFSDGVTEAMNPADELYSDQRLESFVGEQGNIGPEELIIRVRQSVDEFADGAEQSDDITLLAIGFEHEPAKFETHRFDRSIHNDLAQIGMVNEDFKTFCNSTDLSSEIETKVNIIFDELLSNIISYAYPAGGEHHIRVQVECTTERLTIIVTDEGIPFNPFVGPDPDITLSVKERNIGGLGILIVKSFMDKFMYHRRSGFNQVTLIKYLDKENGNGG
ncbi:MAG: SpoIIE family protein phosphatase [Gammaproteobacteria bacterium]